MSPLHWQLLQLRVVVVAASQRPCSTPPFSTHPYCNASLPFNTRTYDLVNRIGNISLPRLLSNLDSGVPSLGIEAYEWWNEALHGVGESPGVSFTGTTPFATVFPEPILTSSSFNRTLFRAIGEAISTEARGFANAGHAGLSFWTPNVNIFRDPRWGRGQETPGEDPTLTSHYAEDFVLGMQGGFLPAYLKVAVTLKHFLAYSLEHDPLTNITRHNFNAIVSSADLADTYLPAFEAGVKLGGAAGLMCSYNAVNGVPSCANTEFLTTVLRGEWGFDGYITSDCGAVFDVETNHHYTSSRAATIDAVLNSGMDSDCGPIPGFSFYDLYLPSILKDLKNKHERVEGVKRAARRLFRVRMRLGEFDPVAKQPYLQIKTDAIDSPEHRALAHDAARQGLVLLKDSTLALPLPRSAAIAVIGPLANQSDVMLGNYHGIPSSLVSVFAGLRGASLPPAAIMYVEGCTLASQNRSGIAAAATAAASAERTVIVAGINQAIESEGHDRASIALPGVQVELITKVAAAAVAAGRPPVTLVILSGGALDIRFAKDDANVGAILWAGYAGQSGGNAVADALFGISPPAGRLTQTWYDASFTKAIAFTDMNMRPNATTGSPGRTHRFYTGTPVYPFGAGITMTQWRYTVASNAITLDTATATTTTRGSTQTASSTHVTVHVENIGSLASDHVVLAFLSAPDAGVNGTPLRSLAAYARLAAVAPGETRDVSFDLDATTLCAALGADTSTSSSGQPRPILLGRYTLRLDSGTVEEAITLALNVV